MRAGIALGSNLGDRLANLKNAREKIAQVPMVSRPILASSVYETEPVDCPPGSPRFLNAVIEVECDAEPMKLLSCLREIEQLLGRQYTDERSAPRTADLDLLYFGAVILVISTLHLPHPRMYQRRFVLEPLAEIRPDLVLPGQAENVATLLRNLPDTTSLVRVATEW